MLFAFNLYDVLQHPIIIETSNQNSVVYNLLKLTNTKEVIMQTHSTLSAYAFML